MASFQKTTFSHEAELRPRVLSGLSEIRSIEAQWRALEGKCEEGFTFFQTFDWCVNWIEEFCERPAPVGQPRIMTLWQGDHLVLLWPAMISNRSFGATVLQSLGEPHTQYSTALHDPVADEGALRSGFENLLKSMDDVDLVNFDAVPEGSLLGRLSGAQPVVTETQNETAIFELSAFASWDDVAATWSSSQRKNRKRRLKKLGELGEVGLAPVWAGEARYEELVALSVEWKKRWLAETGRLSRGFSMDGYDEFLKSMRSDVSGRSGGILLCLEIDGAPVAIEMGFIHRNEYYAYIGGFDYDLAHLSPGKVAMEMALQWLMENGIASYDLLGNPAEYKSSWSTKTVALDNYARTMTIRGKLYNDMWLERLRPVLKKTYLSAPAGVRKVATAMLAPKAKAS